MMEKVGWENISHLFCYFHHIQYRGKKPKAQQTTKKKVLSKYIHDTIIYPGIPDIVELLWA